MKYEIKGTPLPVLIVSLAAGEAIDCENGAMSWMSGNLKQETKGEGVGKMFSRALTGESLFTQTFTAQGQDGFIAFSSSFPGNIIAVDLSDGRSIVVQKRAYLASTPGVNKEIFFQKKFGAGLLGGEGFIMQKFSGKGIVFLEIDGSCIEYELAAGEKMVLDSGYLAMMDETCKMDIEAVAGLKNKLLGGDGIFNTVVFGPGKVTVQTMPVMAVAGAVQPYIVTARG